MPITYLTHPYTENTPSYGNRDQVKLVSKSSISSGDTSNTTEVFFSNNHIGTHIDVPNHFYEFGKTLTDVDPAEWIFNEVELVDIPCEEGRLLEVIDFEELTINTDTDFLIIRTGFQKYREQDLYWNGYPGISELACEYIREKFTKLRAVGFDFISLTSPLFKDEGKKAHLSLLNEDSGRPIYIVEDMKLDHLNSAPDQLIVSPLLVDKGNGGPVTIISIQHPN